MNDERPIPVFVKACAVGALFFTALGIISGPLLAIHWLAKTAVIGAGTCLCVLLVWIGHELLSALDL